MKKFLFASLATVSLCSTSMFADKMTGYISDAHCGAKHSSPSAANTKCVKDMCINGGSDPVLVSDGKVIKFADDDSKKQAVAMAGKNVSVDGTMDGDNLKISSITEQDAAK